MADVNRVLAGWINDLYECKFLSEPDVRALCDKARVVRAVCRAMTVPSNLSVAEFSDLDRPVISWSKRRM